MTVLGGDLAAMRQLASRFGQAGTTFQTQTKNIAQSAQTALQEFVDEMQRLDQEARSLGDEIDTEMQNAQSTADGTNWTGEKKRQLDAAVGDLRGQMSALRGSIDNFAGEASGVVNGSLSTALNDVDTSAANAGSKAMDICTGFNRGVDAQAQAIDDVMNS